MHVVHITPRALSQRLVSYVQIWLFFLNQTVIEFF